jgi:hypothetical protein
MVLASLVVVREDNHFSPGEVRCQFRAKLAGAFRIAGRHKPQRSQPVRVFFAFDDEHGTACGCAQQLG